MNAIGTLGFLELLFTSAIGHALILLSAYKAISRFLDLASRAADAERELVLAAEQGRLLRQSRG